MPHQPASGLGIGGDVARAADTADQREQRGGGQVEQRGQLGPVPGEPTLEPVHQLQVALLVQIHEIDGGAEAALVVGGREPAGGDAVDMELGENGGALGVVEAGDSVVDLAGVVGALAADPENGHALRLELVAKNIAVRPRRLHHRFDHVAEALQSSHQREELGVLVGILPGHDSRHLAAPIGKRRHHVHLGDVDGQHRLPHGHGVDDGFELKLLDRDPAITTLLHEGTILCRVWRFGILGCVPSFRHPPLLADRRTHRSLRSLLRSPLNDINVSRRRHVQSHSKGAVDNRTDGGAGDGACNTPVEVDGGSA
jgi:hypothetical protein